MALPNIGPLSIADVYEEIYGALPSLNQAVTLNQLVMASQLADKSPPFNISMFLGYSHQTLLYAGEVSYGYFDLAGACNHTRENGFTEVYTVSGMIELGQGVYASPHGNYQLGGSAYWKDFTNGNVFHTDANGIVDQTNLHCSDILLGVG